MNLVRVSVVMPSKTSRHSSSEMSGVFALRLCVTWNSSPVGVLNHSARVEGKPASGHAAIVAANELAISVSTSAKTETTPLMWSRRLWRTARSASNLIDMPSLPNV